MIDYLTFSDSDLIILIKGNDSFAYSEAYRRYSTQMLERSKRLLKYDRDKAEEAVCYAFTQLWQNRYRLSGNCSLWKYLCSKYAMVALALMLESKNRRGYSDVWKKVEETALESNLHPEEARMKLLATFSRYS